MVKKIFFMIFCFSYLFLLYYLGTIITPKDFLVLNKGQKIGLTVIAFLGVTFGIVSGLFIRYINEGISEALERRPHILPTKNKRFLLISAPYLILALATLGMCFLFQSLFFPGTIFIVSTGYLALRSIFQLLKNPRKSEVH